MPDCGNKVFSFIWGVVIMNSNRRIAFVMSSFDMLLYRSRPSD